MKQSLRKITGKQILTHKEFLTLFCLTEASLNSRTLLPTLNDPNDMNAPTFEYFNIVTPLTAIPGQSKSNKNIATLKR